MTFLRNAWYCAAWDEEVTKEPFARTILGEPVVLFRKNDGSAVAMSDRCPHRFAPLHRGTFHDEIITCPYHGLSFDAAGRCVHNPHGDGRIPNRAQLRVYPLHEQDHAVWIWTGEAANVDIAAITDLRLIPGNRVQGYYHANSNYQLVIDNLLDLSHAPYLHAGTLSPKGARRESDFGFSESTVSSSYLMRNVETPSSQRLFFDGPFGDYRTSIDWTAPSVLRQSLSFTESGCPVEQGALSRGAHLLTPESETSTHYFWISSRNRRAGDEKIDSAIKDIVNGAFRDEDGPMIEACQLYMRSSDLLSLRPIFLQTDLSAVRARKILARMIQEQDAVANTQEIS